MIVFKKDHDLERFIAVIMAGFFVVIALSCIGCASVETVEDPCKDCPFTERLVQVWTAPDLDPVPDYPTLSAEDFTAKQIEDSQKDYIQAIVADLLILKASVVEHHHWAESITLAIQAADGPVSE